MTQSVIPLGSVFRFVSTDPWWAKCPHIGCGITQNATGLFGTVVTCTNLKCKKDYRVPIEPWSPPPLIDDPQAPSDIEFPCDHCGTIVVFPQEMSGERHCCGCGCGYHHENGHISDLGYHVVKRSLLPFIITLIMVVVSAILSFVIFSDLNTELATLEERVKKAESMKRSPTDAELIKWAEDIEDWYDAIPKDKDGTIYVVPPQTTPSQ